MNFKNIKLILLLGTLLLIASTALAQSDADSAFPDVLSPHIPSSFSNKGIQLGGWTAPVYFSDSESDSWSFSNTLRSWGRVFLWDNSFIYARGKYTFTRTEQDTATTINMIDLDLAMLDSRFFNESLRFSVGRKYFLVGSGFLLNGRGDGAQLEWYNSILNIDLFGSYTGLLQKDDNPYNLSGRDYTDGAKRLFAGGTIGQTFFNQSISLIGMMQKDFSSETDESTRYDSNYFGISVRGFLPKGFDYIGEFFYSNGSTYNYSDMSTADISAMAAIATVNWNIDVITLPMLTLQYAYGSGDKDRENSMLPGGNQTDTDNQFFTFGTFLAGYGLRPTIGNLHAIRAGFAFSPFESTSISVLRGFNILARYSYYMKDKVDAGVGSFYGGTEKAGERFIGQGIDVSMRWRMYSDIAFFANYGLFLPGAAYEDDSKNNTFLMFGMNFSF